MTERTWTEELAARDRRIMRWRLLGIFCLLVGSPSALFGYRMYVEQAERHLAEAAVHRATADSLRAESETARARVDSLARAYAADSVRWSDAARENRVRIARASRRASEVATDLTARLDSVGTALFRQYEAQRDSVETAYRARVADLEAEVRSLLAQREAIGEYADLLQAEAEAIRASLIATSEANAALRAALRAQGRENLLWKAAAVAGVAVALSGRVGA